jgi:hypothetical protein
VLPRFEDCTPCPSNCANHSCSAGCDAGPGRSQPCPPS